MEEEAEALRDQIRDEKRRLEDARRRVDDEQHKVKKQMEAKQRASRRAILQRAKEESLSDDFVAGLLKSLEVVTIGLSTPFFITITLASNTGVPNQSVVNKVVLSNVKLIVKTSWLRSFVFDKELDIDTMHNVTNHWVL